MNFALDPRPVTRLYASWRALLPVFVCGLWGLGAAWMVAVMGFNRVQDRTSDEDLAPRLLTVALVALPAMAGLLVGAAASEVRRRPVTRLLPAVHRRIERASEGLGAAVVLLVALLLGPQLEDAGAVASVALAAAGYALGLFALAPSQGSLVWFVRVGLLLGAYAFARLLLTALDASPFAASVCLAAAYGAHRVRFGAVQRVAPRMASEHSLFTNRPVAVGGEHDAAVSRSLGALAPTVPPHADPRERWRALARFELAARGAGRGTWFLLGIALCVGCVPSLFDAALRGAWPGSLAALAKGVHDTLAKGHGNPMARAVDGVPLAAAAVVFLATFVGRSVLRGGTWRPLPRRLAARLELERHVRIVGAVTLLSLSLGAVLFVTAGLVTDRLLLPDFAVPPYFVAIALFAAATAPWFHAVLTLLDRTRLAGHPALAVVAVVVGMQLGGPLLKGLHDGLVDFCGGRATWGALALAVAGLWVPGSALLASLLARDARTADLARR